VCSSHGALFEKATAYVWPGVCRTYLCAVPLEVESGFVMLATRRPGHACRSHGRVPGARLLLEQIDAVEGACAQTAAFVARDVVPAAESSVDSHRPSRSSPQRLCCLERTIRPLTLPVLVSISSTVPSKYWISIVHRLHRTRRFEQSPPWRYHAPILGRGAVMSKPARL